MLPKIFENSTQKLSTHNSQNIPQSIPQNLIATTSPEQTFPIGYMNSAGEYVPSWKQSPLEKVSLEKKSPLLGKENTDKLNTKSSGHSPILPGNSPRNLNSTTNFPENSPTPFPEKIIPSEKILVNKTLDSESFKFGIDNVDDEDLDDLFLANTLVPVPTYQKNFWF